MSAGDGFGAWLRRQREQRLWTRAELARRIIQSARDHGDTTMPSAGSITHNLYRWERGANGISDRAGRAGTGRPGRRQSDPGGADAGPGGRPQAGTTGARGAGVTGEGG